MNLIEVFILKIEEVISYFGNKTEVAKILKIDRSAISHWKNTVPPKRQLQIQKITKGKLKAGF